MDNANSREYLNKILTAVVENIRKTGTPSVQLTQTPSQPLHPTMTDDYDEELDDLDADENQDTRVTQRLRDKQIANEAEFYESDDEEYKKSLGVRAQPGQSRRRNIMEFQNPNAVPDVEDGDETPDIIRGLNGESGRVTNRPSLEPTSRASSVKPNGTNGVSSAKRSPAPADADGDVEMEEAEAAVAPAEEEPAAESAPAQESSGTGSPAGVVTPPESPVEAAAAAAPAPAVPAAPEAEPSQDVEMADEPKEEEQPAPEAVAEAREEGLKERDEEEVKGEKAAEMAKQDG